MKLEPGTRNTEPETARRGPLHWFAVLVAGLTLVLLLAGALVTSNEAGDSVPDWPLSFGRWLIGPEHFIANVRYEYSHRFIAGLVGIATAALAVWIWVIEKRQWIRWLGLIALAGVLAQAGLGGLRVHFPAYKALIAVPHALVAQSFFGLIVALAVFTSRRWWDGVEPGDSTPLLRRLSTASVAAVLIQLVLGAGFRHQAFGVLPHIIGAGVVAILIGWTAVAVLGKRNMYSQLRRPALFLLVLLTIQLALGVLSYLARLASTGDPQPLEPMISLTAFHLVTGALMLATVLVLTLRCYRSPRKDASIQDFSAAKRLFSSRPSTA